MKAKESNFYLALARLEARQVAEPSLLLQRGAFGAVYKGRCAWLF